MFEDEDEEFFGGELSEDIKSFERMFKEQSYAYFDSDRIEAVIDHLLVSSQFKKAKWAAEQAYNHFPYNNMFLLRKAQAMSLSGELKESVRILKRLEKSETLSLDLMLTIAASFSQLRDAESAIKYFEKALLIADDFEKGEIYIDLAMEYENLNNYTKAIAILKEALSQDPKNESVVYELAYCYDQIKELDNSINCFLAYLDEEPYSFTAWYNLANAYARVNKNEEAIWAYEYCIVVNEDFSPAYFNLGNTYMEINKFEEALESYFKCLEIDGDDGMTYCSIGECYEELSELEESYKAYVKSSELLPQLADAWLGRGIVNDLMGNYAKAIAEIQTAIDLEPDNFSYYHALAGAYENSEQLSYALEAYEKAIELNDEDELLIMEFLKCYFDYDPVEMIKRVLNDDNLSTRKAAQLALVYAFWQTNRRVDALLIFDELLQIDASFSKSLFLHFPSLSEVTDFTDRIDE